MKREGIKVGAGVALVLGAVALAAPAAGQSSAVIRQLNTDDSIAGTEQSKSYKILFDAYLKLTPPPMPVGDDFNLTTIWPGMPDWQAVADWAESGQPLAEAIIQCRSRNILGLPYGEEGIDARYREAGLVAIVGAGDSLRTMEFRYLDSFDVIAAYATAEMYRRLESGQTAEAIDLAGAFNWLLRQLCDREFYEEKWYSIHLLIRALANLRDAMYAYQDKITVEEFRQVAWYDTPELRPGRERLQIPEGDRVVAEALLEEVFDQGEQPDPEKFASVFAAIQSERAPLTRFGAARRWQQIAAVHGSLEASKERLKLIYDDWWRRWRVREYDPILELDTQFDRTNPIRYAAVIYSIQDIADVFVVRNQLFAAATGTAVSAGLCAYKKTFGVYPDDKEKLYGQFIRKITDIDPYDEQFGPLRYKLLTKRQPIDTPAGRLWVEPGECILYAIGSDHLDNQAAESSPDATTGDYVLWPPLRGLERKQKK